MGSKNRFGSLAPSSLRSACQQSDGSLTVNGTGLAVKGRCSHVLPTGKACGCRLYAPAEEFSGVCCDHGAFVRCSGCQEITGVNELSDAGQCARCFVRVMGAA